MKKLFKKIKQTRLFKKLFFKKYKCEELQKLSEYLDENGIKWSNETDSIIERIHFVINNEKWSAICCEKNGVVMTYGNKHKPIELMIMTGHSGPIGYLDFQDVKDMIEYMIEYNVHKSI